MDIWRDERFKYLIIGLVIVTITLSSYIVYRDSTGTKENQNPGENNGVEDNQDLGENNLQRIVPENEISAACPNVDCIPSIENAKYVGQENADNWLDNDEKVIGIRINGESYAYPLKIMRYHEIVNEGIDGEKFAVTYCPICRSGFVFSRNVDGQMLEFGVSGKLYNSNLVMYDRETETLWSQIKGQAIVGPLTSKKLEVYHSDIVEWGNWKGVYSETEILSRETEAYEPFVYERNPYSMYETVRNSNELIYDNNTKIHNLAIVYGISAGEESTAYPEIIVEKHGKIHDKVGNQQITVVFDPDLETVKIFKEHLEGDPTDIVASGAERLKTHGIYWGAWKDFNPEGKVYGLENNQ
uniref:DUF3179 domain-containing protein n=1 Tax=uncultured organism TaxID=155900 RepID=M1P142_9ZZZZ|nr:hypothetical protein FLSS-9_0013 [uncultured organism]